MSLLFRLLWVLLTGIFRKRLKPLEASVLYLPVLPNDLDIYLHMNNGRYQTLMDLGRMDWILRTGLGKTAEKNEWKPLVASVKMTYRKALTVFQGFELHTRIIFWNDKWFFLEQIFERNGTVVAWGLVKGLFRGPQGNVPSKEVLAALQADLVPPEPPESAAAWIALETS